MEVFSLDEKSRLNTKVWTNNKMKRDVSSALKQIADSFIEFVNCKEMVVKDITITGSVANYTWHDKSDIDLHIIVDMSKIKDQEVFHEMFMAKKGLWNLEHDIQVKEFPVEIYIQPSDEPHKSSGVYSILNNKWLVMPRKTNPSIDDSYIIHKSDMWKANIDRIISSKINNINTIDKLKVRLRDMRKMGLYRDGEFSVENLAFKILRRDGYITKLYQYASKVQDEDLSLS
jgi:predicted nucleotidyltransferase